MDSYSNDLRLRILEDCDGGMTSPPKSRRRKIGNRLSVMPIPDAKPAGAAQGAAEFGPAAVERAGSPVDLADHFPTPTRTA